MIRHSDVRLLCLPGKIRAIVTALQGIPEHSEKEASEGMYHEHASEQVYSYTRTKHSFMFTITSTGKATGKHPYGHTSCQLSVCT